MQDQFNLLFPEWQGYASHQEVYHGAQHFCKHTTLNLDYEVPITLDELLTEEDGIIGKSSILNLFSNALNQLNQEDPASIFMVGGTCGCELAPVSFLNQKYDSDLAVFWFDAHGDLNTPKSSPSQRFHGMPLRSLLGEGDNDIISSISRVLDPTQVALVGARDLDAGEQSYIENHKIPVFRPESLSHVSELLDFARLHGFTKAYIHFDLDVLDPMEFPHVLVAVDQGIKINNAISAMQMIRNELTVVGCSLVEFCPKGGGVAEVQRLVSEGMGIKV